MKNKAPNGKSNLAGAKIARIRNEWRPYVSQRAFADKLQLMGLDVTKNEIQAIESGRRVLSDVELKIIAQVLGTTADELLETDPEE